MFILYLYVISLDFYLFLIIFPIAPYLCITLRIIHNISLTLSLYF